MSFYRLSEIPEHLRGYFEPAEIGLEASPDEYVEHMVSVFREVRRVMKKDATLWLNIGDSYNSHPGQRKATDQPGAKQATSAGSFETPSRSVEGLKPKDLVGIPWMLAFALRDDGWYLRQDIIWSKPNPMPESTLDRCTKSHEYLFLLSKSSKYFYDNEAIAESSTTGNVRRPKGWADNGSHSAVDWATADRQGRHSGKSGNLARKSASERGVPIDTNGSTNGAVAGNVPWEGETRNKRSVWTITSEPFPEAHFATFPQALVRPCILAGSRPGDTILDPFNGAGTTGLVATKLGRKYIGIELNPDYVEMTERRLSGVQVELFT